MAEKSTFIKLDRNVLNWRWYKNPNTMRLFIHLLLSVNIKEHDFEKVTIHRGEVATSYASLADALNMSIQEARTAISHLKSTGEITVKKYNKFQVITVVNYGLYQDVSTGKSTSNQQAANIQPTGNQQATNNNQRMKECKNDKNERNTTVMDAREEFCKAIESEFGKLTGKLISSTDARLIYQLYDDCTDTALIIEAMQIAAKTYKPKYNGDRIYSFKFFLTAINEATAKKNGGNTDNGEFSRIQYTQGISNRFGVPEEEFI